MDATVEFDALTDPSSNTVAWRVLSGNGDNVVFEDSHAASTKVSFSHPGLYVLELQASDGDLASSETVTVGVLPETTAARNWQRY